VLKIHMSKPYTITVIYFCCKKIICKVSFVMPCRTGYEAVLRRGFEPLQTLLEVVLVNGWKWQADTKHEIWLSAAECSFKFDISITKKFPGVTEP